MPKAAGGWYSSGHISLVESGAVAPSPELIDAYAAVGGDGAELRSLYQQMRTATIIAGRHRREGHRTEAVVRPPHDARSISDRREVQSHYVAVSQAAHYTFGDSGAISDLVCTVQLRAKTAGVRLYYAGFTYPTDQQLGILTVEPLCGATIADLRESTTGALALYLRLDRDLAPDDPDSYTLSFRVQVHSTVRAAPRLRYFADVGDERLVLRANFAPAASPPAVWYFAAADVIDAEHRNPAHEVQQVDAGQYEWVFDRLVPSWCYGFVWTW